MNNMSAVAIFPSISAENLDEFKMLISQMLLVIKEQESILRYEIFFNQDSSCFAMATTDGFRVYNCEPLEEAVRHAGAALALCRCPLQGGRCLPSQGGGRASADRGF